MPRSQHLGAVDVVRAQVVAPRLLLVLGVHPQREVVRGAHADDAVGHRVVLHEAHERAVAAAEPHVAGVGVVVGGRVLDDRETEHVAIERDRALEVPADRRDMVQPAQLHALGILHAPEGYGAP